MTALGEIFVSGKDEVDYKAFIERLEQIRREKGIHRSHEFPGIHRSMYMGATNVGRD